MDCPSESALLDFVGGAGEPHQRAAIEAHVSRCDGCRAALTALLSSTARSPGAIKNEVLARGAQVGRYVVLELVGEGAMGRVYGAYDPVLDRRVALKIIHPLREGEKAQARLLREAQAMARVAHPNLVAVHDAGEHGRSVFIAMEFIEGTTLRAWLRTNPRTAREILDAFLQAGRGLAAAHTAGLVHRDFKPENVLVGSDGRVRVSDFGLARGADDAPDPDVRVERASPFSSLTLTGGLVGTPAYMAPEQLLGARADARADQFAFCVALFEALTGARPFKQNTRELVAGDRAGLKPASIPSGVAKALERGLRAEVGERLPDMPALLSVLEASPRRVWQSALGVTAMAAIVALVVGWSVGSGRPRALCSNGPERLGAVWSATRRAELTTHFGRLPGAATTWQGLAKTIDGWGDAWVTMHREACEATRVRGEQPDQVLAVRMGCLDRRLVELDALTSVLATTDSSGLPGAAEAVASLTPLSVCANSAALLQPAPLPDNPAAANAVRDVQRTLATARALKEAGRFREALPIATAAALTAHGLGHAPTEAEALVLRGELQESGGDAAASEPTLRDGFVAATAAHDDRSATLAAILLSFSVGERLGRLKEGDEWAWHAAASLKRVGADWDLEARLANQQGHLLFTKGDYPGAEAKYRQAYELRRSHQGEAHAATASMLGNVSRAVGAQGNFEEALKISRQTTDALAVALGPGHPKVAQSHNGNAMQLLNLARPRDALVEVDAALAAAEPVLGADHSEVARLLLNRAIALNRLERSDEAIAAAERALGIFEKAKMDFMVAEALTDLGEALASAERVDEAVKRYEQAREVLRRTVGDGHENVSVSWEAQGDALLEYGRPREALVAYREALKRREAAHGTEFTENAFALSGIGRAQLALGNRAAAVEPLMHARALLSGSGLDPAVLSVTEEALKKAGQNLAAR